MERNTAQKAAVIDTLSQMDNHPTAEEIYSRVRQTCPRISRATVYRILNQLVEKGCVIRIATSSGADRFDRRLEGHSHLVCVRCGVIRDLPTPSGVDQLLHGEGPEGFLITGYKLQYEGLCPDCRQVTEEVLHG